MITSSLCTMYPLQYVQCMICVLCAIVHIVHSFVYNVKPTPTCALCTVLGIALKITLLRHSRCDHKLLKRGCRQDPLVTSPTKAPQHLCDHSYTVLHWTSPKPLQHSYTVSHSGTRCNPQCYNSTFPHLACGAGFSPFSREM